MVLLSFDIEEFDMPFEYGKEIAFEDQINISITGTNIILDLLKKHNVKATFFSTATFAINAPNQIKRIIDEGHEIASHTYFHSEFKNEDLLLSKQKLEEITKTEVIGLRMPRMYPVDNKKVYNSGYEYNTSLNPTYLPGRYNNFFKPRIYFKEDKVWQIPASVSPIIRFPLFWLSFHNLPLSIYKWLCKITLKKDKYLNLYFHPWEFTELNQKEKYGFPNYISKNSGDKMTDRLDNLLSWMNEKKYNFNVFKDLINKINNQ
jgi:Polysaccharide deacetylase